MAERSYWDRVVELARISMENPAAAAVLRLHCPDSGDCEECRRLGGGDGPGCVWPCPTVLVIEQAAAEQEQAALDAADFMAQIYARAAGLDAGEIIRPKEPTDGAV